MEQNLFSTSFYEFYLDYLNSLSSSRSLSFGDNLIYLEPARSHLESCYSSGQCSCGGF